jgi:hypothetical protein
MLVRWIYALIILSGLVLFAPKPVCADEVLDWNAIAQNSIIVAKVPGALQPRILAIVHTSIFDAVNGIERRFTPIHVDAEAPAGASRRAAAVQAAYTALVTLFPDQSATLGEDLQNSLTSIAAQAAIENSLSIEIGRMWGEQVANEILAWRNDDGLAPPGPPYLGSMETGKWRPTPPAFLPGLAPTLAHTLPFVIPSPSSFRPQGPPLLSSAEYAASVNEVKAVGELTSVVRTPDQTQSALFWAGTAATFWNRAAASAAVQRHTTLSENSRLLAVLNVAMADALIAAWDSKYHFEFWRPINAIRLASTDGNDATVEQVDWTPLLVNPNYPEYYSGHQSADGSSQAILTAYFGSMLPVEGFSEGLPGVVRSWPNFAAAADEALLARIWGGIHFRFSMLDAREVAEQVAAYVLEHAAQPLHGNRVGQLRK